MSGEEGTAEERMDLQGGGAACGWTVPERGSRQGYCWEPADGDENEPR